MSLMMSRDNIISEINRRDLPVIICGAGIVGKVLLTICKHEGIPVACFCDNSEKVAQSKFCDLDVIYMPQLNGKYKEAVFLISAAAIKDVVDNLDRLGYSIWYAGSLLLKDMDVSQTSPDGSLDYTNFAIENCILCHDGYLHPDRLFFRSIDLIITERCSLKCRDCSNLMQYYNNPKNCDLDQLIRSIDIFCTVIDEVMDFRVIGGETFMNRQWPIIVERLVDEPKAKRVVLYTNGTIVPSQKHIPLLKDDKVLIIISDYGPLSKKLPELTQILKKNRIAHHVLDIDEWLDCSTIRRNNRWVEQNKEIFRKCCAKNMATLSDGKLFRCPYAANASRLHAVPDFKSDYIDLFKEPMDSLRILNTKKKVRDFILHKDSLETCDFCNGRPLSGPEHPPAIQADKPLPYRRYAAQ